MSRMDGKVAVVSGAGSVASGIGNGRAVSILFARAGGSVGAVDISLPNAEETCRLCETEGGRATAVVADVSDPAGAEQAVQTIYENFGRIDILVNNVGIVGARGSAVDVDPDEWDDVMRVNVKSMMLMTKHCVPLMIENGGGAIVNIASVAGLLGGNPHLAYATSKGAVVNMTRAMAHHHARSGVRVNCVAPGMVITPRVVQRGMTPESRESRRLAAPLQTEGTAWDIAAAVFYLASDASRWVTGVVLPVDAGRSAITSSPS